MSNSKRKALAPLFPVIPVVKRQTAAQSLTFANRQVTDLQKKVTDLQTQLEAAKKKTTDFEGKEQALQELRAESVALKRLVGQLTVENENLKARAANPPFAAADPQLQQKLQSQDQHIKHLDDQLRRVHWEKDDIGAKLNAEQQSRAQMITKLSKMDEEKGLLAKQLQQLQQMQQSPRSPPAYPDSHRVEEMNEMQRRIDFLCHENDMLKNDSGSNSAKLQQSLKRMSEEKNGLVKELKMSKEKGDRLCVQLEQAEWKATMLSEQLTFVKRNSEQWQEQSRTLSEHLKRSGGGGMGLLQPQYSSPPFLPASLPPLTTPYRAPVYPSPSTRLRGLATPAKKSAARTSNHSLITIDDDVFVQVKKEPWDNAGPSQ